MDGSSLYPERDSTRDFLDSPSAKESIDKIVELLEGSVRVLAKGGKVFIVEKWSAARVLLIAKAFERKGLFVDLDSFSPERLSWDFSVIAFSRTSFAKHIKDLSLALAAVVDFGTAGRFGGWAAELIRSFFENVSPTMVLEFASGDERGDMLYEILEQEGFALQYLASTTGYRSAILYPAIEIPKLVEELKREGQEVKDQKQGKIVRQFLSEIG